jgi:hypothetical protein
VEVRRIGRQEFNRLYPYSGELIRFIGEGAEWFTNDARSVVGIIARSAAQRAWNYAVLKRSKFGDFRVWHLGEAYGNLQSTRDECRRAMTVMQIATNAEKHARFALQPHPQFFQPLDKGSPLVVLMILLGDVVTICIVLLWLFHWR